MHRPRKGRALAATALLTIAPLVAACSDDDTADDSADTASDTTAAAADRGAFCDAVTAFGDALSGGGDPSGPLETMIATAPGDLATEIADFGAAVQEAATAEDDAGFLDAGFREIAAQAQGDIAAECDYQSVPIDAVEYAFDGMPDTISAGLTAFDLTDAGAQIHEMILYRRAGGTEGDLVDIVNEDPDVGDGRLEEVAVALPVASGDRSVLLVDLDAGDYVAVCFFPVGATNFDDLGADTLDDHRSQGMIQAFTVE